MKTQIPQRSNTHYHTDAIQGTYQNFPQDNWHEDLLAVNPWAASFLKDGLQIATDEFSQKCKQASHARWLAGTDVWNHWADKMLELKGILEQAQLWYQDENGEGTNDETKSWLALADAIFSSLVLKRGKDGYIDFESFVFPAATWFVDAQFIGEIHFQNAKFYGDAHFDRTKFIGKTNFTKTIFNGQAMFRNMSFTGHVTFEATCFFGNAQFGKTKFMGGTNFNLSVFNGSTDFSGTQFVGDGMYENVIFTGDVTFAHSRFAGTAWFPSASFIGNTDFSNALMIGDAWFSDVKFIGNAQFDRTKFPFNARFDNAHFSGITSFQDAEFSDNTSFAHSRFVGETGLDANALPETAEINTISITGPMRKEREQIKFNEMFPSLQRNTTSLLDGTQFKPTSNFGHAKVDTPQAVEDMASVIPVNNNSSESDNSESETKWFKPFQNSA